jgi:hypothetical protein
MWREQWFVGLAIGVSLLTVGCGGATTEDPMPILLDFQDDSSAAKQKYKGKTVRLRVEKISDASKAGLSPEMVNVQGHFDKPAFMINATVSDPAEQPKALALKIGDPAVLEGEVADAIGEKRGMGVIFLKNAKIVP